ncbi:MAG TPA: STAS domain-containing protein [Candidatus Acidoferrum sp.]|nr:STAS domain-containing protein [Candidatus Acidoferrum sp.]
MQTPHTPHSPPTFDYRPDALERITRDTLAAFDEGERRVILDLDALSKLDTDSVRGLIVLLRRSREVGGEVALKVTRPELLRSLSVMALDRLFPMVKGFAA